MYLYLYRWQVILLYYISISISVSNNEFSCASSHSSLIMIKTNKYPQPKSSYIHNPHQPNWFLVASFIYCLYKRKQHSFNSSYSCCSYPFISPLLHFKLFIVRIRMAGTARSPTTSASTAGKHSAVFPGYLQIDYSSQNIGSQRDTHNHSQHDEEVEYKKANVFCIPLVDGCWFGR